MENLTFHRKEVRLLRPSFSFEEGISLGQELFRALILSRSTRDMTDWSGTTASNSERGQVEKVNARELPYSHFQSCYEANEVLKLHRQG